MQAGMARLILLGGVDAGEKSVCVCLLFGKKGERKERGETASAELGWLLSTSPGRQPSVHAGLPQWSQSFQDLPVYGHMYVNTVHAMSKRDDRSD